MKNKPLWSNGPHALAIFDEKNYAVYRDGKVKSYHSRIEAAVLSVCRTLADEGCEGLHDWLTVFKQSLRGFTVMMDTKAWRNAMEGQKPDEPIPDPSVSVSRSSSSE